MTSTDLSEFCPFDEAPSPTTSRLGRAVTNRRRLVTRVLPGAVLATRVRNATGAMAASPEFEARALWVNRFEYDSAEDIVNEVAPGVLEEVRAEDARKERSSNRWWRRRR